MISSVRGVVLSASLDSAVIEVGGVGLLLHVTAGTAATLRPGAEAVLATTLVVREESLTLYGFADDDERSVFNQVQTVSGVGPRLALAMLAIHAPDGLRRAISSGDLVALVKVPGIGRKGAERIVLELRDKIGMPSGVASSGAPRPPADEAATQVREALVGLGWSPRQAEDAVDAVQQVSAESAAPDRSAGNGSAGNGSAGNGSAGNGSAGNASAGNGSDSNGSAGAGSASAGTDVSALLRAALRELGR